MTSKKKVMRCPICEGDQHVISESKTTYFLGCGHSVEKPEPKAVGAKAKK